MSWEPQKFFVGLVDFFSVWLPGAILVYLAQDRAAALVVVPADPIAAAAMFLLASYLAGHFIFLIGAKLDEGLYDRLRDGLDDGQIRRLAKGRRRPWPTTRGLGRWLFKEDKALPHALRMKQAELDPVGAVNAINAYQWCKAKLALEKGELLAPVERFEADSKFFRSLSIVLILVLVWQFVSGLFPDSPIAAPPPAIAAPEFVNAIIVLGLLLLALWRYIEQRAKAVAQAYRLVIAAAGGSAAGAAPVQPGRAGGVVLRRSGGRTQFLLVRPSGDAEKWVLPKGHVEPGESHAEAAVREVLEESGLWARVHEQLGDFEFEAKGESVTVRWYLMEAAGSWRREFDWPHRWLPRPKPSIKPREQDWFDLDGPLPVKLYPETVDLVKSVRNRLEAGSPPKK